MTGMTFYIVDVFAETRYAGNQLVLTVGWSTHRKLLS